MAQFRGSGHDESYPGLDEGQAVDQERCSFSLMGRWEGGNLSFVLPNLIRYLSLTFNLATN